MNEGFKSITCQCGLRARQSGPAWQYHVIVDCAFWKRQRATGSTIQDRKRMRSMGVTA